MRFAGFPVHEQRHRHAPVALARNAPVRTVLDHGFQPGTAPGREELGAIHRGIGGLAQRSATSAAALRTLLGIAGWRVFDANLRAPHDGREAALAGLEHAEFVKLNLHEVHAFAGWLGTAPTPAALRGALLADFGIRSLCITEGERGARLWHEGVVLEQPALPCEVADTIGAGDSFLAMLVTELLGGSDPAAAMRRATRLASFVASRTGALPDYDAARFRA